MNFYVADTHALFWYLINSSSLGPDARLAFDEADAGQAVIYIPAIVIAELYYLNEKKGRPLDFRVKYERLTQSIYDWEFASCCACRLRMATNLFART